MDHVGNSFGSQAYHQTDFIHSVECAFEHLRSKGLQQRQVLAESFIEETELRDLLSYLSSVTSVHLGLNYPSQDKEKRHWEDSPRPPLRKQDQGALFEGIMRIKDTIKHPSISLELCPFYYVTHVNELEHGSIEQGLIPFRGFLKEFPVLETAELPVVMLFGWDHEKAPKMADLLPSTLQKLGLRGNMEFVAR